MSGKLIFVSGFTGAGKTTLVNVALKQIDNLEVLLTYTTRPMRPGEQDSYEYVFVNDEQYHTLKLKSANWDETIYKSYKYASNAEEYIDKLKNGTNIIVSVTPSIDDINSMASIYKTKPTTVWIDTDYETACRRVEKDFIRKNRTEDGSVKNEFDIIFKPSGVLTDDFISFSNLIKEIVSSR